MLKKIELDKAICSALQETIPNSLIKTRKGSHNKTLSYISGSTAIGILNHVFGYNWNWEIVNFWKEERHRRCQ